jgi:mRNA-degrading endonuclease RelE of RelBE toxin-antitoxin system
MYNVLINKDAQKYVDSLTEKSKRQVKKKLEMLKDNPHPGRADKKKLQLPNYDLFRMHVSRSYIRSMECFKKVQMGCPGIYPDGGKAGA